MPKKTSTTKTETTASAPAVAPVESKKTTKAKTAAKPRTKAVKAEKAPVVEEEVVEEIVEESVVVDDAVAEVKPKENLVDMVDECVKLLEVEIEAKPSNLKVLRSLKKKIVALRTKVSRISKKKGTTKSTTPNLNSGFLKPVKISDEMAKFAGWEPDVPKSRVDVTKHICNYIKEHNLQNPEDRRQIKPDAKLKKLLNFDPAKDDKLTYYKIQTYMKPHFTKIES